MTAPYAIRVFGDPVLKTRCKEIETVTEQTRKLAADMLTTMYDAPGVGLAGNQIGVQQRIFVYDANDGNGPEVILNPTIVETKGEWAFDEGCLSVPGLYFNIVRPKQITLQGTNLDGEELVIEADEYLARIFQHETDHLNGFLLLDRLAPDQRKKALRTLRERQMQS